MLRLQISPHSQFCHYYYYYYYYSPNHRLKKWNMGDFSDLKGRGHGTGKCWIESDLDLNTCMQDLPPESVWYAARDYTVLWASCRDATCLCHLLEALPGHLALSESLFSLLSIFLEQHCGKHLPLLPVIVCVAVYSPSLSPILTSSSDGHNKTQGRCHQSTELKSGLTSQERQRMGLEANSVTFHAYLEN